MNTKPERVELIEKLDAMRASEELRTGKEGCEAIKAMTRGEPAGYLVHQLLAVGAQARRDWFGKIRKQVLEAPTEESALAQFFAGTGAHAIGVVSMTAHGDFLKKLGGFTLATAEAAWRMVEPGCALTADQMATAFSKLSSHDLHALGEWKTGPIGVAHDFGEAPTEPAPARTST